MTRATRERSHDSKDNPTDRRLRVLYIDDNPRDLDLVRDILENQHGGFNVETVSTRERFEARMRDNEWDVVLSDLNTLGFKGVQILETVKARSPHTPVILVTGAGSEEVAVESMRSGASDYVLKTTSHLQRLPLTILRAVEDWKRRRTLEEMREMLERTEHIAGVGSWEWEVEPDTVTWSVELYRLLGMDPADDPPPFSEHHRLFSADSFERLKAAVDRALAEGEPYALELDIVRPDGGVRRGLLTAHPLPDAKGTITHLYGSLQDITALRQAEQALRDRERRYRAIVDNTLDVIWVTDLEQVFTYISPSVERMMGYTPEEMVGTRVYDYCDSATSTRIDEALRTVLDRLPDDSGVVLELPLKHKSGHDIAVEVRATVICGDDGTPDYVQGVSRDITERGEMQLERDRLLRAIQHVAEGVVITDPDGTIEYVNPEFERMTGYSEAEAVGQNPRILSSGEHDDAFYAELWRTIKSGRTWHGRIVNRRKDGSLYTEEDSISPVQNPAGDVVHFVAVKRDVTRELELENQLRQGQKMEAVGRLAGGIAHDFNNMLSVIVGYARQARGGLGDGHPVSRDIDEIVRASERSIELTRQLLGFARRQAVSPRLVDLNEVIPNMLNMLRRMIGENIELEWTAGEGVEPTEIDPTQLDQVVANLVVNARDAIEDTGTIRLQTGMAEFDEEYCARHTGFRTGRYVKLTVNDDGSGMDRETLDHIFEPFFTTKSSLGTGLGLATTYGIVKQNAGFINVYSEPGMGTTVNIYFCARPGAEVVPVETPPATRAEGGTETILVVEDEPALLELSVSTLESLGYQVLPADRPGRALELVREYEGRIDLVMSDVVMPEMGGRDLWNELQKMRPELRCIFVSGYPADVVQHHGRLDDGVNFLQKPFLIDALSAKLREVLDDGGVNDERQ